MRRASLAAGMDGSPAFLAGGGETGAFMRAHDWSTSPLGPPEGWPQNLRALVGVMLGSNQAMFVAWGPSRVMLYNDAYAMLCLCRDRHPAALGAAFARVWHDIMDDVGPILERAFAGEATHMGGIRFELTRGGRRQEAHFSFSYTPVRDDDGVVVGMFCPCQETTSQVLAERRAAAERARLAALFRQAPGFICTLRGPDHVFEFVNVEHRRLFNSAGWIGKPVREAFPDIAGQGFYELLDQVFATGERVVMHGAPARFRPTPDAPEQELLLDFICAPMRDEAGAVTGIYCSGYDVTDRKRAELLATEQGALLELVALGRPLGKCLTAVMAAVERLQPETRASVLVADAERKTFPVSYTASIPPSFGADLKDAPINELAIGTCGEAVHRGQPVTSPDIANDGRWSQPWRELCVAHGILACHSEPIPGADGRCHGSLMLCFGQAREPSG
jgi:PAS domain-containing protein